MNILKPQKLEISKLRKIEDLNKELKENAELDKIYLENYIEENEEYTDIRIEKTVIKNSNKKHRNNK